MATSLADGSSLDRPAWTNPSTKALKRVASLPSAQVDPTFLNNLDCSLLTYRMVATNTMKTGCFTETAFGLFDSDSGTVIYNGTDEGLPLLPYASQHVLAPWPQSGNLLSLIPDSVAGTYVSLYRGIQSLEDKRNSLGQLVSKRVSAPPDIKIARADGRHLLINPQTLSFSDGGSWVVAETLFGSFVRINLASLEMKPFAKAYGSQGSPGLLPSSVAVSHDGNFVAIYNKAAAEFKVYDLSSCQGEISPLLAPQTCPSHDYRPFIEGQTGQIKSLRHVRFAHDGLISFNLSATDASKSGIYAMAPTAGINFLNEYLALGDSYTSGEGAFDYLTGTDTENNTCHLSRGSYPMLIIHDIFNPASGHSVACSGARIRDITDTSDAYGGQVLGNPKLGELKATQPLFLESITANFKPGYLAQSDFVRKYQPRIVTVSVGGNDIGFGEILKSCVIPSLTKDTCFNTYEDRLELKNLVDRTIPSWTGLFRQLKEAVPGGQLYAIGYPDIVDDKGQCGLSVGLNQAERVFAKELVDYVNGAMGQAAAAAKVIYVDISQALAGHRLCETNGPNLAVNGLTAGKDGGPFGLRLIGRESYHPNAQGHLLVEQSILRTTNNFTVSQATAPSPPPADKLLAQPVSGRALTSKSFQAMTKEIVIPGETIPFKVEGGQPGLRPETAYEVRLDGPAGHAIGSLVTDGSGNISGNVTLPDSIEPGGHTVDVMGPGQSDKPVDITQPILVHEEEASSVRSDVVDAEPADTSHVLESQTGDPPITGSGAETRLIESASSPINHDPAKPSILTPSKVSSSPNSSASTARIGESYKNKYAPNFRIDLQIMLRWIWPASLVIGWLLVAIILMMRLTYLVQRHKTG